MRGAGGVLGACLFSERSHFGLMGAYKLQKSLEMGNFGTDGSIKGGPGGMWGEGLWGRGAGGVLRGMSLERVRRGFRRRYKGGNGGNRSCCPSTCTLIQPRS